MSPTSAPARQVLVATQVVFFVCVALCEAVAHGPDAEIYGISYFGVHAPTIPLVAIGYGVAAVGLWRTSTLFASLDAPGVLAPGLRVVALGLPLELATPFNHGSFFNWAHMSIGVAIGITQMGLSTVLVLRHPRPSTTAAFLWQLAGGIVAAASLPDWDFNHMLDGEMIFELGFAWCMILWTYVVTTRSTDDGQVEDGATSRPRRSRDVR
jgi:hypothetical protein